MKKDLKVEAIIIGHREWVSLSSLGLGAIKGKVDTGAKTSSLHAFDIKTKKTKNKIYVFFKVHPLQGKKLPVVQCKAPLLEKRIISDSGGHKEERFVIETEMLLAGVKKNIEITLTDRSSMKYRMLIGRSALTEFYIDPTQSYLSGKTLKQKRYLKEISSNSTSTNKKS